MSTAARKARKRAGAPFSKPPKRRTRRPAGGLGLVSGAEILAAIVVRDLLGRQS